MNQNPANPRVGKNVYIAPTAYVGGDVRLGDGATVMHHAAIRGDIAPIRVGARTNVQDGSVLHTRYGIPLDIADEVVIGHRAVVHCRSVGTRTLIGIGAIILDEAEIGNHCIIAAGAVVTPGTQVPDGSVFGGVPARLLRPTHDGDRAEIARIVESYVEVGGRHAAGWYPNIADAAANHPPTGVTAGADRTARAFPPVRRVEPRSIRGDSGMHAAPLACGPNGPGYKDRVIFTLTMSAERCTL
jgi:carbonic anhydrase/acetyltransferase-like protein (isoleucine patch superfamily)